MRRFLIRISTLAIVVAAASAAFFVAAASASYNGAVDITCTGATYHLTTFPSGSQDVLLTVFVDGAVAAQNTVTFQGPSGDPTIAYTIPADGKSHSVEANAYSITNSTAIGGLPGVVNVTCGTPPPPPPTTTCGCQYSKFYYRDHPDVTAAMVARMGGSIQLGARMLTAAQAQAVLAATSASPGTISATPLVLEISQQILTAELNLLCWPKQPLLVQQVLKLVNGLVSANVSTTQTRLGWALFDASSLAAPITAFNAGS
jgi:hypothetical protein